MRKVDIRITKARISRLSIEISSDEGRLPHVTATIDLLAANGKKVSDFTISTQSWHELHFDLPATLVPPIRHLEVEIERLVALKCSSAMGELPAPGASETVG